MDSQASDIVKCDQYLVQPSVARGRAHVGLGGTDVAASAVLQLQPSTISFVGSGNEIT